MKALVTTVSLEYINIQYSKKQSLKVRMLGLLTDGNLSKGMHVLISWYSANLKTSIDMHVCLNTDICNHMYNIMNSLEFSHENTRILSSVTVNACLEFFLGILSVTYKSIRNIYSDVCLYSPCGMYSNNI